MDAEHKRPFAAFVVVAVASALLLGESLRSQPHVANDQPAVSQVSGRSTATSSPASSPASGQVVDEVTPAPTITTVKSIGRTPMLIARGDNGLGVSIGAVRDQAGKPTNPVRTWDNETAPVPQGQPGPPDPKPSGGPPSTHPNDDGTPGNSGDHAQVPKDDRGPRHDGVHPTPPSHGPQ